MESLAAVSSVFAVVSLAIQLAKNVQELIDFWHTFKEASSEVAQIKSQLLILSRLLGSIQEDVWASTNDQTVDIGLQCLLICKESITKLEKFTNSFNRGLSGTVIKCRWAQLRKTLKERELSKYFDEIERAKSTVIIYQMWGNGKRNEKIMELVENIDRYIRDQGNSASENCIKQLQAPQKYSKDGFGFKKSHLSSNTYQLPLRFGTIRIRMINQTMKLKTSDTRLTELCKKLLHKHITASFIPSFCSLPILECSFSRGYSPWNASFRTLNVRPDWSPIFKYCTLGDIPGVQGLLARDLASPNDVDQEGLTALHYAAVMHHAELCRLLIQLGAVTDAVTNRQATPLLLASNSHFKEFHSMEIGQARPQTSNAQLDTIKVLVELGDNDPMNVDDIGRIAVLDGAGTSLSGDSLSWLMNQDNYELDLQYVAPTGHTAAAYISLRDDLSPELLAPLLRSGIDINGFCASTWHFNFRYRLRGPTMLQYAVWVWYEELSSVRKPKHMPTSLRNTINVLLSQGADLHALSASGHTILDGLVLNIIRFDNGCARPLELLDSCMEEWFNQLADLNISVKDYIDRERILHGGMYHDLGLGLYLFICFDENADPKIWTEFQGPEEREKNEFVDHIARCTIWPEWRRRYALPEPLGPKKASGFSPKMIVLKECSGPPLDRLETISSNQLQREVGILARMMPILDQVFEVKDRCFAFAIRYRVEFTFYIVLLAGLFGCSYLARFWVATAFFMVLKLFQDTILY